MGKNQAYKAMQRSRVGSSSAGPEQIEDGMEDELSKCEPEADKDKMMREYRAQLDAEREMKLARGRNRLSNKSNHKEKTDRDLKKRSSKKRKVTDGVEPDLMNVFVKAYTSKDSVKDLEMDQIFALRQSQGSLSSEATSSMKPILTQVIREGKGKYVRGHGKHQSKKEVAISESQYMTQQITQLVHEEQYLTSQNQQMRAQLEENTVAFNYVKDLLTSICGQLNIPVPPMPFMRSSTPEEGRSVADEAEGPRPGSFGGQ